MNMCNYCNLLDIKKRTKDDQRVTLIGDDCYRHPKDIDILKLSKVEREKYFVAWFMELPKYCCC